MSRAGRGTFAIAAGLALLALGAIAGQAREPRAGEAAYLRHCASCHGVWGTGDGPVASILRTKPPDLTRLTERYGTPLPIDRLAEFVDGRRDVRTHGPREMPVWGELLAPEAPPGPEREAAKAATIRLILQYLETLQGRREA